jgi:hypothetical protein
MTTGMRGKSVITMASDCYHGEVIRTQISLDERQMDGLRELARQRHVSMAELVRQAVDALLAAPPPDARERALGVVGRYSSGEPDNDVARNHDKYLAEIYGEW